MRGALDEQPDGRGRAKVDTITASAAEVSQDVAALTALFSATVGQPLLGERAEHHRPGAAVPGRPTSSRTTALATSSAPDLRSRAQVPD